MLLTPLDADQTASLFAGKIRRKEQFFYLRYGDGALECIHRLGRGRTCDGEYYSAELGRALHDSWDQIVKGPNVYVGDWFSASHGDDPSNLYAEEYLELVGGNTARLRFVHFEALLLMRESERLLDFYRAIRADTRRKLYVGPLENMPGADLLNADYMAIPMQNLFAQLDEVERRLQDREYEVMIWGAGMAGSILAERAFFEHPDRTFINIGSGLDPLFRGKSRSQQLPPDRARAFMAEFLK